MEKTQTSVAAKILWIGLTFSLPIAVLTYLMVSNINSYIDFAAKEVRGDAYLRPLVDLLEATQDHQLTLHRCSGSADCKARLAGLQSKAEAAYERLVEADRSHGVALEFTDEGLGKRKREHLRVATVRGEWANLVTAVAAHSGGAVPKELDDQYDHHTSDIRGMITHAGDTSNLILDPDLDSYYLMDVVLLALPQTQDRLARVATQGLEILRRGSPALDERIQLAVHRAMLQEADLDRVVASSQTALTEDPNFYGASPTLASHVRPPLERYSAAARRLVDDLRRITAAGGDKTPPEAFVKAAVDARTASFEYWRVSVNELDKLLSTRVASYQSNRTWALLLAALAVVVSGLIALYLAKTITDPLHGLVRSLGPGATLLGVCAERIAEASQKKFSDAEEATIICEELSAHADDMRKAVLQLAYHVQGAAAERMVSQATGQKAE